MSMDISRFDKSQADPVALESGGAVIVHQHKTLVPDTPLPQFGGGRSCAGVRSDGKVWSYSGSGFYQVDSFTATNWASKALPTNCVQTQGLKVVAPEAGYPGAGSMFLLVYNSTTTRFEVYSTPLADRSTAPTWSSVLLQLPANVTIIPTMFRSTSAGIFVGEYSGVSDISGGPSLHRSVDGTTFTTVLGPLATTRHIHGVYEDPYNLGTIYVTIGDYISGYTPPYAIYRSTDGGATFSGFVAGSSWQAVAMGFTADYIVCCGDAAFGAGPYMIDRRTGTPRWLTMHPKPYRISVPGATGGRWIADAVLNTDTSLTSATAAFVSTDVGRALDGNASIPKGTYIQSVTNATTIVMSAAATGSGSSQTVRIGSDQFYSNAYAGVVDPASGWLYLIANDASNSGNVGGIFVCPGPDKPIHLLHTLPNPGLSNFECYAVSGNLFVGRFGPYPLLSKAR